MTFRSDLLCEICKVMYFFNFSSSTTYFIYTTTVYSNTLQLHVGVVVAGQFLFGNLYKEQRALMIYRGPCFRNLAPRLPHSPLSRQ
jgi:hypothetical protein